MQAGAGKAKRQKFGQPFWASTAQLETVVPKFDCIPQKTERAGNGCIAEQPTAYLSIIGRYSLHSQFFTDMFPRFRHILALLHYGSLCLYTAVFFIQLVSFLVSENSTSSLSCQSHTSPFLFKNPCSMKDTIDKDSSGRLSVLCIFSVLIFGRVQLDTMWTVMLVFVQSPVSGFLEYHFRLLYEGRQSSQKPYILQICSNCFICFHLGFLYAVTSL